MKKLISLITVVLAFILWGQYTYYSTDFVDVGWEQATGATEYNVKVLRVGQVVKQEINVGKVVGTTVRINRPRTGHFEVWVNAENQFGVSGWAKSVDPSISTVNGGPMGWRLFFDVPVPGGGGIE